MQYQPEAKDRSRAETDGRHGYNPESKRTHILCSSIVYSTNSDGSLRICLDPTRLNESIKRCSYKMPTLEEINPEFVGAKHFSKLDAKAGHWSVQLEEESQLLTTFSHTEWSVLLPASTIWPLRKPRHISTANG